MPRAQIKDEKTYRKLRSQGESKEKSARIANAAAGSSRSKVGRKGGKSGSYDDWSKQELVQRARELKIQDLIPKASFGFDDLLKRVKRHLPAMPAA